MGLQAKRVSERKPLSSSRGATGKDIGVRIQDTESKRQIAAGSPGERGARVGSGRLAVVEKRHSCQPDKDLSSQRPRTDEVNFGEQGWNPLFRAPLPGEPFLRDRFGEEGSVDEVGLMSFSKSRSSSISGVPGSCVSESIFPLPPTYPSV